MEQLILEYKRAKPEDSFWILAKVSGVTPPELSRLSRAKSKRKPLREAPIPESIARVI